MENTYPITAHNVEFDNQPTLKQTRKVEPFTRSVVSNMPSFGRKLRRKANDINRKGKRKYGY